MKSGMSRAGTWQPAPPSRPWGWGRCWRERGSSWSPPSPPAPRWGQTGPGGGAWGRSLSGSSGERERVGPGVRSGRDWYRSPGNSPLLRYTFILVISDPAENSSLSKTSDSCRNSQVLAIQAVGQSVGLSVPRCVTTFSFGTLSKVSETFTFIPFVYLVTSVL